MTHIFEIPPWENPAHRRATLGSPEHIAAILAEAGLPGDPLQPKIGYRP